jgi:hypothetical protein
VRPRLFSKGVALTGRAAIKSRHFG